MTTLGTMASVAISMVMISTETTTAQATISEQLMTTAHHHRSEKRRRSQASQGSQRRRNPRLANLPITVFLVGWDTALARRPCVLGLTDTGRYDGHLVSGRNNGDCYRQRGRWSRPLFGRIQPWLGTGDHVAVVLGTWAALSPVAMGRHRQWIRTVSAIGLIDTRPEANRRKPRSRS